MKLYAVIFFLSLAACAGPTEANLRSNANTTHSTRKSIFKLKSSFKISYFKEKTDQLQTGAGGNANMEYCTINQGDLIVGQDVEVSGKHTYLTLVENITDSRNKNKEGTLCHEGEKGYIFTEHFDPAYETDEYGYASYP